MPITTANMGLTKWSELTDPYDHAQLAGNFQRIDEHDHTTGKGVRLSGAALQNEAINTAQLKNLSVTNEKLAGGITGDKLASGVVATLGDFKYWWRPNNLTPLPSGGWVICAGQTLGPSEHEFPGGGNITLPNLIERFIRGTELGVIGSITGASSVNLNHNHELPQHTHSVPAHTHFLNLETGYNANTNLKISQDLSGSAWVHSDNENNVPHKHSINGSANESGPWTSGANGAGENTSSNLGSVSIIPINVGLLPMIKVHF